MEFVRKRLLTIPLLKLSVGVTQYVKITGAMHLGKEQKPKEGEKKKDPAWLAACVNLQDGAECQIILSAVVKSVLTDEYPNDGYVNRCFAITKQDRAPGKQYNQFNVEEIEDPVTVASQIGKAGDAGVTPHPAARQGGGRGR